MNFSMAVCFSNSCNYMKCFLYLFVIWHYFPSSISLQEKIDKYDLIVIGGGSGGLACAKEARQYNKSVVVLDYVIPSARGTTWGIGGICLNVGCIPKKLFHQAALLKENIMDGSYYGWNSKSSKHNWHNLTENVSDYLKSVRWKLRREINLKQIHFKNAMGFFIDRHTVNAMTVVNNPEKDGYEEFENITLRGDKIVIAVGCRSMIPAFPKELNDYCITSDDIFSLKKEPGKTLVIGAGYIGLEVAGFLNGLGYDVTVAVRNKLLKDFDKQMVNLIKEYMMKQGVKFCIGCEIMSVEYTHVNTSKVLRNMAHKVTFERSSNKRRYEDVYDTLFCATGRRPNTKLLDLNNANVKYDDKTGKIPTVNERTNIPNIYAVGDVLLDKPELTPVAAKAGHLLAKRLFGGSKEKMDYSLIPTVIFTPLEYGRIGWNENEALEKFGEDNIEVYHSYYYPLEWEIPRAAFGGDDSKCYLKVISLKETGKIVGIHFTGPHAGDILQGFAVAMKAGLTESQLKSSVGIHPTISEEFTRLSITKSSGLNPRQLPCCS